VYSIRLFVKILDSGKLTPRNGLRIEVVHIGKESHAQRAALKAAAETAVAVPSNAATTSSS